MTHEERMEGFKKRCREKNFRLTPQKIEIFSVLSSLYCHPRAEKIYETLQEKFPTLSFATVYRNLKQFVEIGVAQELDFGDGFSRFDANTEDHDHLIFQKTKEIRDICIPNKQKFLPENIQSLLIQKVALQIFVNE